MKQRVVKDREDRIYDYEQWRRRTNDKYPSINIDSIEFRVIDGYLKIVGVLELTRFDMPITLRGLKMAWRRVNNTRHGSVLRTVAEGLGVDAYLVAFSKELNEFQVCRLLWDASYESVAWKDMTQAEYHWWRGRLPDLLPSFVGRVLPAF